MRMLVFIAALILGGCAPLAAAGGIGVADVTVFHGCIGVTMSNWMPWERRYTCKPVGSNPQ